MSDEFYLTLLSNSSLQVFPENKTSSFSVKLPREVKLSENYEVALCEISYPATIENVTKNNNQLVIRIENLPTQALDGTKNARTDFVTTNEDSEKVPDDPHIDVHITIPVGYYQSLDDIVYSINNELFNYVPEYKDWQSKGLSLFNWDATRRRLKFDRTLMEAVMKTKFKPTKKNYALVIKAYLQNRLALQIGYEPKECLMTGKGIHHHASLNFGYSDTFMVYMDLVEPQIVGDVHAQIIKVVQSIEPHLRFGDTCFRSFTDRNYIPLLKRNFETISVDIRESAGGRLLPFSFGSAYILLHFRKIKK